MRLIRVAVPVPTLEALTYHVPDDLGDPAIGARVLVPLGTRTLTGVVIETGLGTRDSGLDKTSEVAIESGPGIRDPGSERTTEPTDPESRVPNPGSVKPVLDVLDDSAFLPADVVALTAWVSEYYACGPGEALAAAMPPRAWVESERYAQITAAGGVSLLTERGVRLEILEALTGAKPVRVDAVLGNRRGSHAALLGLEREGLVVITRPLKGSASAYRTVRVAVLTAQGHDVAETVEACPPLGPKQREALALRKGAPDGIDAAALDERGISAATLKRLSELGLIRISRRRVDRDPFEQGASMASTAREPHVLTSEQAAAFERLRSLASAGGFQTALLHGVTGSGKTELYLRLADTVRRTGRGVLMLVPEIALTPAVAAVFRETFG